jgi:hypothetical protein
MYNYRSDTIIELQQALLKAQSEFEVAEKSKKSGSGDKGSRTWKYADWPTLVESSRKALAKNGLCVMQPIMNDDNGATLLSTLLIHKSGEWVESRMSLSLSLPPFAKPQDIGSCITYFKRYSYQSIIGLVTDDGDDDGVQAQKAHVNYYADKTKSLPYPKVNPVIIIDEEFEPDIPVFINDTEYRELMHALKPVPEVLAKILNGYKIDSLRGLPRELYRSTLERINNIKRTEGKL